MHWWSHCQISAQTIFWSCHILTINLSSSDILRFCQNHWTNVRRYIFFVGKFKIMISMNDVSKLSLRFPEQKFLYMNNKQIMNCKLKLITEMMYSRCLLVSNIGTSSIRSLSPLVAGPWIIITLRNALPKRVSEWECIGLKSCRPFCIFADRVRSVSELFPGDRSILAIILDLVTDVSCVFSNLPLYHCSR